MVHGNPGEPPFVTKFKATGFLKSGTLYAIVLGWPTKALEIKSLASGEAKLLEHPISDVTLLGSDEKMQWSQTDAALVIQPPHNKPCEHAFVFRIAGGI